MSLSKQGKRRKLAQMRAALYSRPWSLEVRTLGALTAAVEAGDVEAVKATLAIGQDKARSIAKIVNGVAVIPVCGVCQDEVDFYVLYGMAASYQQIEDSFKKAVANSEVKAILFYFDTPGGSAIGCKRLADLIFNARGTKPIRAYVQGMCCSAGFYMAAACDRIESTPDALVASVGTIYPHLEMSGFLKETGYGATVFTNADSPKKGHGNFYEPLSDEARKTLQEYVNSYGRPFVEDVARYRKTSPDQVVAKYGQGDVIRADVAVTVGVIDAIVVGFQESLDSITNAAGKGPSASTSNQVLPVSNPTIVRSSTMNERIKAQLFALGLVDSLNASDEVCKAALAAWCKARGEDVPSDEAKTLATLQSQAVKPQSQAQPANTAKPADKPADNVQDAHNREQAEARLESLSASAAIVNAAVGCEAVTAKMILDAATKKLDAKSAMAEWQKVLAEQEPAVPANRIKVTDKASSQYETDVVDAMAYRAGAKVELSAGAEAHVSKPLWAVAVECLNRMGHNVDMYGDREGVAHLAMSSGAPGVRHSFYSTRENRRYVQASAIPASRPGDFPGILSALANKYLDLLELDTDFSYPLISAMLPGGLNDFKPGLMVNKGIVEELDEVQDAEAFKELGLSEEVLSYIFMRRFGNKFGWTPVMIANDDLNAFAEGMIGLEEAWQVTQNRLCVDLIMSNPTLLDGSALFANRADVGTAANNNDRTAGAAPSDSEWAAMETLYADIGGVGTQRRVRGTLNTIFVPTGTQHQEAVRTFAPLNIVGEDKAAATTANLGLYRSKVAIVPESELRGATVATRYYGFRSPTMLNTATIVRAYFNGFGEQGRRERWYDPENKTTWVSLEGRIATAVKNWRYAIRNKGAA